MRSLCHGIVVLSLLVGSACSDNGRAPSERTDTDTPDTDVPIDTTDTGRLPGLEGDWMAISGSLRIIDGLPAADAQLTLAVLVSDAAGTLSEVACGATLRGPPQAVQQVDDDVVLYGNWLFDIDAGGCSGLAATLELGIGPLDPAIWPAADEQGASLKHTRGLYTPNATRTGLWIFGTAGTSDQIAGQGTPTSLEPLPDGDYHLRSAYLLDL